jgi:SAM-dependent methyltransferase
MLNDAVVSRIGKLRHQDGIFAMLRQFINWNRKAARGLETKFPLVFAGPPFQLELGRRIAADLTKHQPKTVLEVGGINRPFLKKSAAYEYVGLDIDVQPECYAVYDRFIVQSIEIPLAISADMIISVTLMEHVPNNDAAVATMHAALNPGGTTHHYIPSKWHPYSVALRVVGPALQKKLIPFLRPAAVDVTGYPTFFNHCAPAAMRELFAKHRFKDIDIYPFYRANDYFAFFLPVYVLISLFENLCAVLKWRALASGFVISARKGMPDV